MCGSFLRGCAAWMPSAVRQGSCCPGFLTGSIPSGMWVSAAMHVWWRLHWSMHRAGLWYLAAKSCFSSSQHSPWGSLGPCLWMGHPCSSPAPQGCVSPGPCPSHPACQEPVSSHVCCRERGKPSPRFRAGLDEAPMPNAGRCGSHAGLAFLPLAAWGCPLPAMLAGTCGQLLPIYV